METEKYQGSEHREQKTGAKTIVYASVALLVISALAYIYKPARWELLPAGLGLIGLIVATLILREKVLEILRLRSTIYGTNTAAVIIIVTLIISMLNFIAYRHPGRIDLTESGVFSLSEQTKSVLRNLQHDVNVIAFVSDTPGARNSIEDLLKGYRYESKKFNYEFIDPNLNPDMAERYNITSENTLIVMSGENQTKISEATENAITNAIIKVTRVGKKKIYFTEGHGERDIEDNQYANGFYVAAQGLRDLNYEVYKINLSTRSDVPSDASALIVADPEKPFLSNEIELLEKYLETGGRVVMLIDQKLKEKTEDAGLVKLLNKYGVFPGDDVVIERELQLFAGPTLGIDPIIKSFVRHPVTEPLKGAVMLSLARTVDFKQTEGIEGTVLAKTSEGSWAEKNLHLLRTQRKAAEDSDDRKGPVPVAVAVKKSIQSKEENKENKKEMRMVVIGDADFANNKLFNTLFNGDFFLNSVNWLGEEMDLISISAKDRKTSRIIISSQQRRWLLSSLFAIPIIFIISGFVVWRRRRSL
jgi:ABC-type uncharacterized transport system involved in gliding motility auxiliary subunit